MGYTIYLVRCIHLGTGWQYYARHPALKSHIACSPWQGSEMEFQINRMLTYER